MNEMKSKLDLLWESVIKEISIDISSNKISLKLELIDNGRRSFHNVEFNEVASFYFVNNIGDHRLVFNKPEKDDFLELTSISYLCKGVEQIKVIPTNEVWANQCFSSVNFVLELWSKILFVEANEIVIDGRKFYLAK